LAVVREVVEVNPVAAVRGPNTRAQLAWVAIDAYRATEATADLERRLDGVDGSMNRN
jgi:hypothetical protein